MSTTPKPIPFDDATFPATEEAAPDVRAWQMEKIKAGLKDADEGRFASAEDVKAVHRKLVGAENVTDPSG